ncbi:MAG: hypothetical protein ACI854_000525 [Arenicella sp.]|jgi:hypothetical protein
MIIFTVFLITITFLIIISPYPRKLVELRCLLKSSGYTVIVCLFERRSLVCSFFESELGFDLNGR